MSETSIYIPIIYLDNFHYDDGQGTKNQSFVDYVRCL